MDKPTLPDLDLELCRQRQDRLRGVMEEAGASRALLARAEQVQWLTGFRPHPLMAAAVLLEADRCVLIAPNTAPARHAASEVATFAAQHLCTLRQDQEEAIGTVLESLAPVGATGRVGMEGARAAARYAQVLGVGGFGEVLDLSAPLLRLRRRKDPDEMAMLRHAIAATGAMYERAREMVRPGVRELEVYGWLQAVAVTALGEPPTAMGNDYQCNSPGGAPRDRAAEDGALYILDLGPAYRGYFADNCRTLAVNGEPTPGQREARCAVLEVLAWVEASVRPGVSCAEVYRTAKAMLDRHLPDAFPHHLGHGIGLYPHETPHLNPEWDDVFEEGDVFTAEPGLYVPELRAGIRIEENYRVTAAGVEKLSHFSTEL